MPADAPLPLFAMRMTPEALAALTVVVVVILAFSAVGVFEQAILRDELVLLVALALRALVLALAASS